MIQIKIGICSDTFSNMGPMRGQYVFLIIKVIYIFFYIQYEYFGQCTCSIIVLIG